MDVLEGLLGEQEFLYMTDETYAALGSLLDDNLGGMISQYLENPDADKEVVNKINQKLGTALQTASFTFEVDSELDSVCKTSTELLGDIDVNVTQVIEKLSWIRKNKEFLRSTIPPRQKSDFDAFQKGLSKTEYPEGCYPPPRLLTKIKNNSMLFYRRNEKPRLTGLSYFVAKSNEWEMKLQALMFIQYKRKSEGIEYLLKDY